MADLLDSISRLQSDPTCMDRLARSSGLHSLAGAQTVYASAVPMAVDGLIGMVSTASGAKVLLRRAQDLRTSDARKLRDYFGPNEDSIDDELAREVFGSGLTAAIRSLAMQHGINPESARSVLETSTGVSLALAVRSVPGPLTLEGLTAPILAEQQRFHEAPAKGLVGLGPGTSTESTPAAPPAPLVVAGTGVSDRRWPVLPSAPARLGTAAAVFVGVVALGCGILWLSQTGGEPTTLPFVDETTTSSEVAAELSTGAAALGVAPAPVVALDLTSPPVPIGAPDNYAVMSDGYIFLRGYVPSADVETLIVAAVGEVLGPERVVSEYVIDPDEPFEEGREVQVYIEETVLFETASSEIAPDFFPLLGIGLTLLELQDGVVLEVIGHTDSIGDDSYNLQLSQRRVDAVQQFFVSQGIDPDRVIVEGRGESEPRASNDTEAGRQANRRVEFLITGFRFSG